jgi:hypothetical protein
MLSSLLEKACQAYIHLASFFVTGMELANGVNPAQTGLIYFRSLYELAQRQS